MRKNGERFFIVGLFLLALWVSLFGAIRHTFTGVGLRMIIRPSLHANELELNDGRIVYFRTRDGSRLGGVYFASTRENSVPIVICHGNMQTVQSVLPLANTLHRHGFSVLVFDYRGFGLSQGQIRSFMDLTEDLREGINFVARQPGVDGSRIGIIALSLGTAPATIVSETDHRVKALVLHAPIHSGERLIANFVPTRFGSFFARFLVDTNGLNTSRAIVNIRCPLLVIQEENDIITPAKDGQRLFHKAQVPKDMWLVPNEGHLGAFGTYEYHQRVIDFLHANLGSKA